MSNEIRQKIDNERDMLEGNLNRMCVTDDVDELVWMYAYACIRVNAILEANRNRIRNEKYPILLKPKSEVQDERKSN